MTDPEKLQAMLAEAWIPARLPPPAGPLGPTQPVTVMGVVDDERLRINGEGPFVDVVSWWPARAVWTVTHCSRADREAVDFEARVRGWQPMLELPPPWSDVWA